MGCRVVAVGSGHELFDSCDGANAAPGSGIHAVQGGGSAGEIELALEGPGMAGQILKHGVDKGCVEDVACAGGVDDRDFECGSAEQAMAVPCDDPLLAECGGGEARAVTVEQSSECSFEVGLAHVLSGEVAADDDVVDVFKQHFNAGVALIEIGDDGDVCFVCPLGGEGAGCGVESVNVQEAGRRDPLALQIFGLKDHSLVALTEHGAFAFVDHDDVLQTGGAGNSDDPGVNSAVLTGAGEGFAVQAGGVIFAQLADVARRKAPGLAGDNSGCSLTSGLKRACGVLNL